MAVDLIATISALPGRGADVVALLTEYGQVVAQEPGNERFEVYADRDDPDHVVVVERYRDEAAFQAHLGSPENPALNERLGAISQGGSSLRFLVR